jgi:2,3-bisphosphoglycerate-independent phosphoglycerate mutase
VGHLVLGSGRPARTTRHRAEEALRARKLGSNPIVAQTLRIASDRRCRLHLLTLLSPARAHASLEQLFAVVDEADFQEVPVVVHAILDGRDSPPRRSLELLDRVQTHLEGRGIIGTISGRSYAMDTDERWDRTYRAFQAIVRDKVLGPEAQRADTPFDALHYAYGQGLGDDTLPPVRIGDYTGLRGDFLCDFAAKSPVWEWTGEEVGMALHYRPDGLRPLVAMLTRRGLPPEIAVDLLMDRDKPVLAFDEHCLATLTDLAPVGPLPVAFEREVLQDDCGAVVAAAGLRQLRCAESLKAAHVTEFWGGGRLEPQSGEQRVLVPSPIDLDEPHERPVLRTAEVAEAVARAVAAGEHALIVVNFAAADLVAHTGGLEPAVEAVRAVDQALGRLGRAVLEAGGALCVTSDHGHVERLLGAGGAPLRGHSTSPVPFVLVSDEHRGASLRAGGSLCDVAPTLLALLGLEAPATMTGRSLLGG